MTNKIPVGITLAEAGRFVIRDFFRILGVIAIPMAVWAAPGLLMQGRIVDLYARLLVHDYSRIGEMAAYLLPLYLIIFVLIFMQMVGIARLALGLQQRWFYFSLGKPVWRLIGSFLLLLVAALLGYAAVLLGGVGIGFLLGLLAKLVNVAAVSWVIAAIAVITFIAGFCAYIYGIVRVSFLLLPVIAAEEDGFALRKGWALGSGNFWRMFAMVLVVAVPALGAEMWLMFGYLLKGLTFPPPHASAEQIAAYHTASNARTIALMDAMSHYWYIVWPAGIILTVLFYGFIIGAQCFAYRALKEASSIPVPGDTLP